MEGTAEVKASTEQAKLAMEKGGVVVLDFGGQYTQLIARRVREQQVFSAVLPCTTPLEDMRKLEPAGIGLDLDGFVVGKGCACRIGAVCIIWNQHEVAMSLIITFMVCFDEH